MAVTMKCKVLLVAVDWRRPDVSAEHIVFILSDCLFRMTELLLVPSLLYQHEDGGYILLRNVRLSTNYSALQTIRQSR
jgi:hypothetical protein